MTTTDTVLRQWHMLRLVQRYPQKISMQAIKGVLEVQGFDSTERTIQRNLVEFSRAFPLVVDDRAKPFGWSWQRDAHSFYLPGLTVSEALTWVLAEPQPQRGRSWLDKVRTVPPAQTLIPPTCSAWCRMRRCASASSKSHIARKAARAPKSTESIRSR